RRRWAEDLEESRRFLRALEREGRAILDELRRRPEPAALEAFVREAEARVAGDAVEVVGRGIRGELVEVAGARARIQRGAMRFEVPAAELRVVPREPARERVAVAVER